MPSPFLTPSYWFTCKYLNIYNSDKPKAFVFLAVCERVRTGLRSGQGEDESEGGMKSVKRMRPVRINKVGNGERIRGARMRGGQG